ncbi:MAG: tetratricopeptide repeat protein [Desulfobacterales bacterium]|nr:tetratricopeptide repeat protein [Desulfobacterales bacterium]
MHRTLIITGLLFVMVGLTGGSAAAVESNVYEAYYGLGVFAYEQGNYKSARMYFKKALAAAPDSLQANHYLGRTFLKLNAPDSALRHLQTVWADDPDRLGIRYDRAMGYYLKENFSVAADLFAAAVKEAPRDVLALYYAGLALYKTERFEKAVKYLTRAIDLSPGIQPNAAYYIGICLYRQGDISGALERFNYIIASDAPISLKEAARQWRRRLKLEQQARKRYRLYVKAGMQYDDNVCLQPEDDDLNVSTISDESDWLFSGYLSGRFNVLDRQRMRAGVGYSHYQTRHSDLTEYDITGSIGNLFLQYDYAPFFLDFSYRPAYYWVHADSFLRRHELRPELTWQASGKTLCTLSYAFEDNNYFNSEACDGRSHEVGADVVHLLSEGKHYLSGGIGFKANDADAGYESYDEFEARLSLEYEIDDKTRFMVIGIYNWKDYDQADPATAITREDHRYFGAVSLSRKLYSDWLDIVLDYSFTRNDSNTGLFDYRRNAVAVSLSANL